MICILDEKNGSCYVNLLCESGPIKVTSLSIILSFVTRYEKTMLSAGIINLRYGFLKY